MVVDDSNKEWTPIQSPASNLADLRRDASFSNRATPKQSLKLPNIPIFSPTRLTNKLAQSVKHSESLFELQPLITKFKQMPE